MQERKSDILAENFKHKTGVDLRDYKRPELVDTVANLISFPIYAGKLLIIPLAIYFLLGLIPVFMVEGSARVIVAIVFIPLLGTANAVTTAAILLVIRLSEDISKALTAGLSLTAEVTSDVRNVYQKRDNRSLQFPTFAEIFNGVMYVVVVPTVVIVINRKVPLIGGLFSGLVRRLADLTTGRTIRKLAVENPEVLDIEPPPEIKEKWLIERMKNVRSLAAKANKLISGSITWATIILLLATFMVQIALWSVTIVCYWLIL